jgi:hypothetical protein
MLTFEFASLQPLQETVPPLEEVVVAVQTARLVDVKLPLTLKTSPESKAGWALAKAW